ncbi:YbaN family protein [uncultured Bartonella sp.]|uniref:YbaN family protein n=1 Tax=uncultured Bartonella sp. TaxID=104108 RepID=UPI002631B581|nr:YbaN family protein [uncultured Bartonella sp.]
MKEFNTRGPLRVVYYIVGCLMIVLGIIGAVLPIMPTVPFLLVASWCFARSSPRFHNWLHNHKVFGPPIKQWEEQGAIAPFIKFIAIGGMSVGFCSFLLIARPALWLALVTAVILISISIYILTRPSC